MAEEKVKRDWVRISLDIAIPIVIALLSWAGVVLWGMSKAQIKMYENQKSLAATVAQVQETQETMVSRMTAQEIWKAETAGNRFTVSDGHVLWKEIAEIRRTMAALPLGEPPEWFVQRVENLANRIDELEHRLNGR